MLLSTTVCFSVAFFTVLDCSGDQWQRGTHPLDTQAILVSEISS